MADIEHLDRCSWHEVQEGLNAAPEINLTASCLFGGFIWEAIEIAKRADAGANNIWRQDIFRNRRVVSLGSDILRLNIKRRASDQERGSQES